MSEVVLNLLANAVEAIEGSGRIIVTTRHCTLDEGNAAGLEPGPYVCLSVQDTGCGMSEEVQARIFEPFFTTKFQGRGMGLAVVYGIVDNHEGHISVRSESGQGTTFEFYFPAIEKEIGKPSKPERTDEARRDTPVAGTRTVLLVEDDESVLKLLRRIMGRLGHSVLVAHDGQEAVDLARTFQGDIDLALLDLGMPEMGGAEAYPLLAEARPAMKIIICSGYELDERAQSILDAGASAFIQKPFQMSVLEAEISKALKR
jgi:CheY-like chemotaxis protein